MQSYEISVTYPNNFTTFSVKKYKWSNVITTSLHQTKNLTIQIMENKERLFNAKRALYPIPNRISLFTQPLNVLIVQRMSILKGRYYRLSQS
jgi:hypothetical protein